VQVELLEKNGGFEVKVEEDVRFFWNLGEALRYIRETLEE
jgi:hypothetical protein